MSRPSWSAIPGNSPRRNTKRAIKSQSMCVPRKRIATGPQCTSSTSRPSTSASSVRANTLLQHDYEVDEVQDHVVVALDKTPNGKIGCAYYIARHELLCCMQDIERGGSEIFEALKAETEPTVMLISSRIDYTVTKDLRDQSSLLSDDVEHRPLPFEVVTRPAPDFKYEHAMNKLALLDTRSQSNAIRFLIPGENMDDNKAQTLDELGLVDQPGRLLSIASNLDLENKVSIGCAGAVMNYLQRKRASLYLQHDLSVETAYKVSRVEMFTLMDTMLLSTDTLSALQIIQSESHPNVANQGPSSTGSKESLSVYGLFYRFAKTPQGKAKLRQMIMRPSLDINVISNRHDFVSMLLRPENQSICDSLSKSLTRIKNMQTTLTSLRRGIERSSSNNGTIRSGVWAALLEFCFHCIDVGDAIKEIPGYNRLEILAAADQVLDRVQLQRTGKMVHDVVDLDESLQQHRTVVKPGISDELDQVKEAYDRMEEVLADVATTITNQMPSYVAERLNVVFLPQLGFHVVVPLNTRNNEPVWEGDKSWERRFRTEKYQYFKNTKMRDMDAQWGDLHADICDAEIEISHNLAQRILQHEAWLIEGSKYCGELDCLLALAHGARQYKLVRPKMVAENMINIKNGRHLLQEMKVASYISNDTCLAGGDDLESGRGPSMTLLTGPNYSGKSTYMKQVALIVYMAQIGSFVPAEAATLGMVDKILTRINTAETVSKAQSAFLIDLQQIACALNSCTNRSFLILDEFGKGTDSCDGAGLACGVFKYLLGLGAESPMVLASTHFHEIFGRGDFDEYNNLEFAHMEVQLNGDSKDRPHSEADKVTYFYTLRQGRSGLSYGIQCAATNGISAAIVERATLLTDMVTRGEDLVSICSALPDGELGELRDAEAICRMFLSKELEDDPVDVQEMLQEFFESGTSEVVGAENI